MLRPCFWKKTFFFLVVCCSIIGCDSSTQQTTYDIVIAGGTIYDGSGKAPYMADIGIVDDRIASIGELNNVAAKQRIDATGKAVSPGFINMIGWGVTTLIKDGRGISDLTQGITLEVFGEGESLGPLSEQMKLDFPKNYGGMEAQWTSLGEYLEFLEHRGVSPNIASFIGAATPRMVVLGEDDIDPSPEQLKIMQGLVKAAMEEGALGVASSLIYTPANFAETPELIALAKVAAEYDGLYASHMRNEGKGIFEALDEFLTVAREANIRSEIYHIKISYPPYWDRFDEVLAKIENARAEGFQITADMYPYPAGSTGLDVIMPTWVRAGGIDAWIERMQDPETRIQLAKEMREESDEWDNRLVSAGPEAILLVEFQNPDLKKYAGRTLADVAMELGKTAEETAMDLVIEDRTRVGAVFFNQSEDVVRQAIQQPWISFCTDAVSIAAEGDALLNHRHPRTYGTYPRVLGHYSRDLGLLSLAQAIRRASGLPADNLKLRDRGYLREGFYADVVVFDPATIKDNATFAKPHQYSTGITDVLVNGIPVIQYGEHTGATPGKVVRGPGWSGWKKDLVD